MSLKDSCFNWPGAYSLNEKAEMITKVPGYRKAPEFEPILHFIGENAYVNQKWEQFFAGFSNPDGSLAGGIIGGKLAGKVKPEVLRWVVVGIGVVVAVIYIARG